MATVQRRVEFDPDRTREEVSRPAYAPLNQLMSCPSYDLPEDVFEPGEKRPTKGKKAKAANKTANDPSSKKRSHAEAKLDVRRVGEVYATWRSRTISIRLLGIAIRNVLTLICVQENGTSNTAKRRQSGNTAAQASANGASALPGMMTT